MLRAYSPGSGTGGGKVRRSGRGAGNGKGSAEVDPYFSSVSLLCHFNGTNGSTTFTDSGPLGLNLSVANGSPVISTSQSVFGGASLSCPGSAGVVSPSNAAFTFGVGDFTFEMRYRAVSSVAAANIVDMRPSAAGTHPSLLLYTAADGSLNVFVNGATTLSSSAGAIAADTWYSIAYTRTGTNTGRLFINGALIGSWADGTTYTSTELFLPTWSTQTTCFYDELRITKGVARYTAAYTPASSAFPNS